MSERSNNSMETVSFRRFLSYIYAYEDDTKLRNVGFAKVEVRPPRVRFQVTVNGILQKGGRPLELCLVDKNLQRIPVGQLMLQNGRGEYRGSGSLENLWDSGMAFSQVYGICLQGAGNKRHYYMTLWKEIPRPVRTVIRPEENRLEESWPEEKWPEDKQITVIPGKKQQDEQQMKEGTETIETIVQAAEVTGEQEEEVEAENADSGAELCSSEAEMSCSEALVLHNEENSVEEAQEERQNDFPTEHEPEEEVKEELESASELIKQQSIEEAAFKCSAAEESSAYKGANASAGTETIRRQTSGRKNGDKCMELWKRFCARYPHVDIRPLNFNDRDSEGDFGQIGKICEVIRIRPNDIGRLPRNNWILAHNSFLQNAYNHYHQLILFRVENGNMVSQPENRWFIGLPGENSEQETLVAEVFGFKKYLLCKNGGFWYTEIMMG